MTHVFDNYAAALDQIAALEAQLAEAQQEHTDMMWQRRRADERVEDLSAQLAAVTRERDEARRDGRTLLANIDYMMEAREADLDPDDIAVVEQIRISLTPPSSADGGGAQAAKENE